MPTTDRSDSALIGAGDAILGLELGSTRIKACLVAPDARVLASGTHSWQSRCEDGIWTYDMADVWAGLAACYAALAADVRDRHGVDLTRVAAIGVSAMMHGYIALDREGRLLVPFRTWRNNVTGRAVGELTPSLGFAVPERWSIAHLYQAILEDQPHVPQIARLTTLAGYVHFGLTGNHVLGVGDASGMFPIDPATGSWDRPRIAVFDELVKPRKLGWTLAELLPPTLPAGRAAGRLSVAGAQLLDPTGKLAAGSPLCPPEGDAGTGMVATNAVRPRSGSVSAGTSMFAMVVLEQSLSRPYPELDVVVTPDGRPVAMAHANNGSSDLDAWLALFGQAAKALGSDVSADVVYEKLLPLALDADADAGGLLSINYVAGEHVTGFSEGRPLFARGHASHFTLANFVRALYFASLCALRTGMNLLLEKEGVTIDELRGHGGFFKGGDTGQRMMAAALNVPISVPAMAAEGGAWGMALLAAYMLRADARESLADYLDARIAASIGKPVRPTPRDVQGFAEFFVRHQKGLAVERQAVNAL
jgi:sugar (pentulose or hexulose) kinase